MFTALAQLLPSSRPRWAMMPSPVATHFAEMLLFVAAALEQAGLKYIIHYGTLLGAARLGAPLPWDEDHDVFLWDTDPAEVREKLEGLLGDCGYRLSWDPQGFFWVRERYWMAGSGHLALAFLPPLAEKVEDLPLWEGGAPHLLQSELLPLRRVPIYTGSVWAPQATEQILSRLYGDSAHPSVMAKFAAPSIPRAVQDFWASATWPEVLHRWKARSRWRHHWYVPWWWFNGGYIIFINRLRRLGSAFGSG